MKRCFWITLLAGVLLNLCPTMAEEGGMKVMTFSSDDMFMIPGLGAMILPEGEDLKVEMIPEPDMRPDELKSVDLQEGDIIMMFNGKRMKSITDLREGYEALAIGDTVKLGIKRDKGMLISSFEKPDAESLESGQMVMMTRTIDDDDESGADGAVKTVTKTMGQGMSNMLVVLEAGILVGGDDEGAVVQSVIGGNIKPNAKGDELKEGDRITSLGDAEVLSFDDFKKQYDALQSGSSAKMGFTREGQAYSTTFTKSAQKAMRKTITK